MAWVSFKFLDETVKTYEDICKRATGTVRMVP
jgi:hypothetical protein